MQPSNRKICLLAIVGTMLLASHCKSHQMNMSNTWTLPQDGFTVFYRFFRDKISWYEADAVCQFHHANLVTVDNGVKYDASRAYLSDLNVTENVWIGLMRSQNSDRFMWSNSKILDREFGYWAEQIPAIDSPMCAVVDPMRDYRWHSLRCGGPDVASFLCEMEAPEWATECLIRALPSLTIQYIADSATIELSRDCGAEGMKRLTCNGKQDQDLIQRELMCTSERETITSDNEMRAAVEQSPSESIDDMSQSDNSENNNIDKVANQIEASVDKVGDKFNLDDVMMGDAPIAADPYDVKPVKNPKKITAKKSMKNQPKQQRKMKTEYKEEFMMGDQPAVPIPSVEILPHVKKVVIDDLKKPEEIVSTPRTLAEIQQTTVEVRNRRETENPIKQNVSATTTEPTVKSDFGTVHLKAHKEISKDHFIPPMLLVQHQNATVVPATTAEEASSQSTVTSSTTEATKHEYPTSSTQQTQVPTTDATTTTTTLNDLTSSRSESTPTTISPTSAPFLSTTQESSTVSTATTHSQTPHDNSKSMMRPHAPKFGGEISYNSPAKTAADITHTEMNPANASETTLPTGNISNETAVTPTTTIKPTEIAIESTHSSTQAVNDTITEIPHLEVSKRSNSGNNLDQHQNNQDLHKQDSHKPIDDTNKHHADFTNSNLDYQNYKPNRKRILTKAETHSFIQKVFG